MSVLGPGVENGDTDIDRVRATPLNHFFFSFSFSFLVFSYLFIYFPI